MTAEHFLRRHVARVLAAPVQQILESTLKYRTTPMATERMVQECLTRPNNAAHAGIVTLRSPMLAGIVRRLDAEIPAKDVKSLGLAISTQLCKVWETDSDSRTPMADSARKVIESVSAQGPILNLQIKRATFAEWVLKYFMQQPQGQVMCGLQQSVLSHSSTTVGDPQQQKKGHHNDPVDKKQRHHYIVEYSSPNIAKPFHAGHLRSTLLGAFLVRGLKKLRDLGPEDDHFIDSSDHGAAVQQHAKPASSIPLEHHHLRPHRALPHHQHEHRQKHHRHHHITVHAMNYMGDWGRQYGVLCAGLHRRNLSRHTMLKLTLRDLVSIYVDSTRLAEQDTEFATLVERMTQKLEARDHDLMLQWAQHRHQSLDEYRDIYAILGVHFDEIASESDAQPDAYRAITRLRALGRVTEEENGAAVVHFNAGQRQKRVDQGLVRSDQQSRQDQKNKIQTENMKETKNGKELDGAEMKNNSSDLPPALLARGNGTPVYIARDVADAERRFDLALSHHPELKPDDVTLLYVVGREQELHFRQLRALLQALERPDVAASLECVHVGQVRGMSTRKGTSVLLRDILSEAEDRCHELMQQNPERYALVTDPQQTALALALSSIVVHDFKKQRIRGYDFDWGTVLKLTGEDCGAYLQYTHSRLCSVMQRVRDRHGDRDLLRIDDGALDQEEAEPISTSVIPPINHPGDPYAPAITSEMLSACDCALLINDSAQRLLETISRHDAALRESVAKREPVVFVTSLLALAKASNRCVQSGPSLINAAPNEAYAHYVVFGLTVSLLRQGLELLGLPALKRL
eukprot:Clim_evm40s240 gene=Clim_evmTU40s240